MPRASETVNSLNGGELSPEVFGRTDIAKYRQGAARVENFIIHTEGGAHRRNGTRFIQSSNTGSAPTRLASFTFSSEQSYILAFNTSNNQSGGFIIVYSDELPVQVIARTFADTDINTTTNEITIANHGYSTSGSFQITDTTVIFTASPAIVEDVTEFGVVTAESSVIASVDTGTNQLETADSHAYVTEMGPFRFTTTGEIPGGLDSFTDYFVNFIDATHVTVSETAGGSVVSITSTGSGTFALTPTGAYQRNVFRLGGSPDPRTISAAGTGPHTMTPTVGNEGSVLIRHPYTLSEVNELQFVQSADFLFIVHPNHRPAQLSRLSDTQWAFSSINLIDGPYRDQNLNEDADITSSANVVGAATTLTLNADALEEVNKGNGWIAPQDIGRIVRMERNNVWGYHEIFSITSSTVATALVISSVGQVGATDRWRLGSWYTENYPTSISFVEQRLIMAGEVDTPQTLHGSNSGKFNIFRDEPANTVDPLTDDLSLNLRIAANQVNAIRWMGLNGNLFIGTDGALFLLRASLEDEAITPTNVKIPLVTSVGSRSVQPVNVGSQLVYATPNSQSLRGAHPRIQSSGEEPVNLNLLANHIFGRTNSIVQIAYQFDRNQVIWVVLDDGSLSSITYVPEQEVFAWHRHMIGGIFDPSSESRDFVESDVDISEDTISFSADHGYLNEEGPFQVTSTGSVPFPLALRTAYYILLVDEVTIRLSLTPGGDVIDLQNDGTGTHTISRSDPAFVESVAVIPAPDQTHDQVWISVKRKFEDSQTTRTTIELFEDEWFTGVQTDMRFMDSAVIHTGSPTTTISGLDHLEKYYVQVLADGAAHPDRIVSSGSITLNATYSDVVVGLRYVSELETIPLDPADPEGSSMGKKARQDHLNMRVLDTIGGEVGPDLANMDPIQWLEDPTIMGQPPEPFTGDRKQPIEGGWQVDKRVVWRQKGPFPFNLLAVNFIGQASQR